MKTGVLSFLFVLFLLPSIAQNPWLDAAELNRYMEFNPARNRVEIDNSVAVDEDAILTALEKYCPNAVSREGDQVLLDLNECFKDNPFISFRSYAQQGFRMQFSESEKSFNRRPLPDNSPSAQGGSFVTNLADGLAMFLVARTKEELNAAFFDHFRRAMKEEEALQVLFPSTFDLLYVIDKEIYNYNAYLESMRESFIRDMKTLPMHVRDFSTENRFIKKEQFRILTEDLLGTAQYLIDGQSPLDILDFLANTASIQQPGRWANIEEEKARKSVQDIAMGLKTLDLISNSIRVRGTGQTWATTRALTDSLQNASFSYLYLGLLYQQSLGVQYSDGVTLQAVLKKMHGGTALPVSFRNYLRNLSRTGEQLDQSIATLKRRRGTDSISYNDYYRFANLMFDFLELISNFRKEVKLPEWKIEGGIPVPVPIPNLKPANLDTMEQKFLSILRQVYELEFNIRQNHYTSAVNNVASLLTQVLGEKFIFKKDFLKYANFMASVAEANTSEEVAMAIDLFALPPGSSRLKKQSSFSVSLNSYGGLGFGWENDVQKEVSDALDDKEVLAISAPLGIDLNVGLKNDAGSISFYTQLIDVGAIFAYRFSNQTERIPEIKFQNIIAPGFYAIYGFGNNIPLSAGIGAQLGPNLRKIDPAAGLSVETTNAWRFGLILSVDIPITHFYTK
jgi:hypothetical protein